MGENGHMFDIFVIQQERKRSYIYIKCKKRGGTFGEWKREIFVILYTGYLLSIVKIERALNNK